MMKKLWLIRLLLAVAFLVTTVLVCVFGHDTPVFLQRIGRLHIVPLYLAESAGVIVVWLLITLVWGRVYCSTVCPVGTLQDIMLRIRRRVPSLNKEFRYRKASRIRHHIFIVYLVCLLTGLVVVPLVVEPLFITANGVQAFGGSHSVWVQYGFSAAWGVVWGIVSSGVILPWSLLHGRRFCNTVCPLGTAMSYLSAHSAYQISIDGNKCVSCMRCQDNCRAECIQVSRRYVDNARCVRCMECVAKCPSGAIRYTQTRHRPLTPLFGKVKQLRN